MRKSVLALCLAAFASLLALGGGGMNRRRILASLGSHTPTAKDYVQDGLVAMWDGIENAGWGVHDPNATVWVDLVDGRIATPLVSWDNMFNDIALHFDNNVSHYLIVNDSFYPDRITMEASSMVTPKASYSSIISCTESGGTGIVGYPNRWSTDVGKPGGGYYGSHDYDGEVDNNPCTRTARIGQTFDLFTNAIKKETGVDTSAGIRYNMSNKWQIGKDPGDNGYLEGDVFCIRIYGRAITDAEIAHNYAIDKARFNLPDVT